GQSYIEKESKIVLKNSSMFTSFLETKTIPYNPVFEWIQVNPSNIFSNREGGSIVIENTKLHAMNRYTVILNFTMTKFEESKSFIFSYSGCNSFNVYIDENDNLNIGDPCKEENNLNTGIIVGLNEKVTLYIAYHNTKVTVLYITDKNV